jgi:hypothetical protein
VSEEYEDSSAFDQAKAAAREEYKDLSLRALAEMMKVMREEKDELEAQLKLVNAKYDVLRYEAIPNKMDEEGMEKGPTYDGIGRISLTADLFVSTKDKNGLFSWLRDFGMGDIIQPSVNASTLKAFIKGRMKDGKDVPSEFVNITPVTRASITKAK